jgi:2-oxoglutarate ferredoxin oxidoreductase subunit beta
VNRLDVIMGREEITADYAPGTLETATQHDGSILRLRKLAEGYDPRDRIAAMNFVAERQAQGEVVTGLLFVDPDAGDLHSHLKTVPQAFNTLGERDLCPGAAALAKINAALR